MPCSRLQDARRAFARVLVAMMRKYGMAGAGHVTTESTKADLMKAFRRILLRVHPDKGGTDADVKALVAARDALTAAEPAAAQPAPAARPAPPPKAAMKRPAAAHGDPQPPAGKRPPEHAASSSSTLATTHQEMCEFCEEKPDVSVAGYTIRSNGALLTYNGLALQSPESWADFVAWVEAHKEEWGVLHYSCTRELCRQGRAHHHLMLQFRKEVHCFSSKFTYNGIRPNARAAWRDYCGSGRGKKNPQVGLDRAFFYVWANKIGTCSDEEGRLCVHGNYAPVWTDARFRYEVKSEWSETLWRRQQLTHDMHNEYIVLCRDRVPGRLRNLQEVVDGEMALANKAKLQEDDARVRQNPELYKPYHTFAIIEEWLATFGLDALRYAICIIFGPSRSGKTELGKSWFKSPLDMKVGQLVDSMPAKMRQLDRAVHDGLVFDDVRDLEWVVQHQHALQGKPGDEVWFAETQGGTRAYSKNMFQLPIVVTINKSTKNLDYLDSHDFLGHADNRVVLRLTRKPWDEEGAGAGLDGAGAALPVPPPMTPEDCMRGWSVAEVETFFNEKDMATSAKILRQNDVCGADLLELTVTELTASLRATPFLGRKIVRARDSFLGV